MAELLPDATIDGFLDTIADTCDRVDVCSTQPTTYTQATSTYTLGNTTLTTGDGGGDWTIANGDTSGRKLSLAQQAGITATGTDTAQHIAFTDGSSTLLAVATCTSQSVTSGNSITINAFDVLEIADPA